MSKIQNSINIYQLIWRRLSRPTQDFGNCHVLKVQNCDVTAVVTDTIDCSKTTATNVSCWADVANHVTRFWQRGDTKNFERRIKG